LAVQLFIRADSRKLLVKICHYDLRKYFCSNRIINIWNSLPDSVVMDDTVKQFKHRLDKYWKNYDFCVWSPGHLHLNWRPILSVGNTCM